MNRMGLLLAGLVLVGLLVFVSQGMNKVAPREGAEEEEAATAKQAAQTAKAAPLTGSATIDLPPEIIVNDPAKAKSRILVGWQYTAENQPNPQALSDAIQAVRYVVQNSQGKASAVIVNVDVPPEDRSPAARAVTRLGIEFGRGAMKGNMGEEPLSAMGIQRFLTQAIDQ